MDSEQALREQPPCRICGATPKTVGLRIVLEHDHALHQRAAEHERKATRSRAPARTKDPLDD